MVIRLTLAAILGGLIGCAELAARYRDRPFTAILLPSGLLYLTVNAATAMIALIGVEGLAPQFGLPDGTPPEGKYVIEVLTASIGSAAVFRASFTLAQDRGIGLGPILLLRSMLNIVDAAMERKRTLSRLSHNDLAGLSFVRDHVALAELCCHALQRFELAEAQRLGELAADLWSREDLTDADKLDCFGLELCMLVGERALRKAADRLRERMQDEPEQKTAPEEDSLQERRRLTLDPRPEAAPEPSDDDLQTEESHDNLVGASRLGPTSVSGRLSRRSFRDS